MKAVKYQGCVIEGISTEKFPNLVQITKTTKKMKSIQGKKFISLEKAKSSINGVKATLLISSGEVRSKKELESIGMGPLMNY